MTNTEDTISHPIAAAWGVIGVALVILYPILSLYSYAIEAVLGGMDVLQWIVFVANVVFMAWSEGYRGFQLRFSPRVASRALYLYQNSTSLGTRLLAPFFCVGYFKASRRSMTLAWVGTLAIIILVLLVNQLSQPWRGIIDAGVVVGLTWGLASLLVMLQKTFATGRYLCSPEVP
jgi:hypothetical protein